MYGFIYQVIFVLICTTHVGATNLEDDVITPCGKCTCKSIQASADCSNNHLKNIPMDLPSNTTDLNLARNHIAISSQIQVGLCQNYPGLTKVSVAWNGLRTLSHIFKGCKHLEHLDLTGNVLEFPNPKAFEDLQSLQELFSLEVQELHPDTFSNLKRLETLNLTLYGITIQPGVFHGLSSLKRLTLALEKVLSLPENLFSFNGDNVLKILTFKGSKVKDIPDDLLDELDSLKEVHLDLPQLLELKIEKDRKPKYLQVLEISNVRSLAEDTLSGLEMLETVKLHGIGDLGGDGLFKSARTVKELEIVQCSLTELPTGWLDSMVALETLNLSDNGLEKLSPIDFVQLTSLKHLILSNNKIQRLSSGILYSLKATLRQLLINDNQLKRLDSNTFTDMDVLEVLDLRRNTIRHIAANSFRNLPRLKILWLSGNYISSLDHVTFESFPMLREVDLAENMIAQFPETLFTSKVVYLLLSVNNLHDLPGKQLCKMRRLQYLGLEDNPIFCDCSLRSLHKCLPDLQIHGRCFKPTEEEGKNIEEITECISSTTLSSVTPTTTVLVHTESAASSLVSTISNPSPSLLSSSLSSSLVLAPSSSSSEAVVSAPLISTPSLMSSNVAPKIKATRTPTLISASSSYASNLMLSSPSFSTSDFRQVLSAPSITPASKMMLTSNISAFSSSTLSMMIPASSSSDLNLMALMSSRSTPDLMTSTALIYAANLMLSESLSSIPNLMSSAPDHSTPSLMEALQSSPTLSLPVLASSSPTSSLPVLTSSSPASSLPVLTSSSPTSSLPVLTSSSPTSSLPVLTSSSPASSLPVLTSSSPASSLPVLTSPSPTSSLPVLTSSSPTSSLPVLTSSGPASNAAVTVGPGEKIVLNYDDYGEYEEIVRPLVVTGIFDKNPTLPVTFTTEQVLSTQSSEIYQLYPDQENISRMMEGAMNESEIGQSNNTRSTFPGMAQVKALPAESDSKEFGGFLSQVGDVAIAIVISLAVMVGISAGVWLYRKYSQSGSYTTINLSRELSPGNVIQMEPVVVQHSVIPNQKRSNVTIESANHSAY